MRSILLLLGLAAAPPPDDARVDALRSHAVPVRAATPADDDLADLAPVAAAIGDARVVLLGSPTFGDGAAFRTMARLVRLLHREHGFSVLAWESGLYDCHVMQRKLEDPALRTDEAASFGVLTVYGASAQCLPLFKYARTTLDGDRPLRMAGIDPQFTGRGSEEWLDFVLAWLDAPEDADAPPEWVDGLRRAHRRIDFSPFFPTEEQLARARQLVDEIDRAIADPDGPWVAHHGTDDVSFVRRTLESFVVHSELRLRLRRPETRGDGTRLRARTMGENLAWLLTERHPDARIVVWATATHAARGLARVALDVEGVELEGTTTCGDVAREALGDRAYSILFTAYDGEAALVSQAPFEIPPAPPGSFEDLAERGGGARLFVDLRSAPAEGPAAFLRGEFRARPFGYQIGEAAWREVCDAFLFVRTMTPSTLPPDDEFGR